jgi:hypothetical protein
LNVIEDDRVSVPAFGPASPTTYRYDAPFRSTDAESLLSVNVMLNALQYNYVALQVAPHSGQTRTEQSVAAGPTESLEFHLDFSDERIEVLQRETAVQQCQP